MGRSQALQSLQEGVPQSNRQQHYPDFENSLPYYLSSVPQPHSYGYTGIPDSNTTAVASPGWNSPNPFLDTDLSAPLPTANLHPAPPRRPAKRNPPLLPGDSIPGKASPHPSKKFECCGKIMRSDNMIVHLRSVHRERVPPGTWLRDWIRQHPNGTVTEV